MSCTCLKTLSVQLLVNFVRREFWHCTWCKLPVARSEIAFRKGANHSYRDENLSFSLWPNRGALWCFRSGKTLDCHSVYHTKLFIYHCLLMNCGFVVGTTWCIGIDRKHSCGESLCQAYVVIRLEFWIHLSILNDAVSFLGEWGEFTGTFHFRREKKKMTL